MDRSTEDPFPGLLARSLARIGSDGRFPADDSSALARAIRGQNGPAGDRSAMLDDPESVLGPFEALPPPAQKAIVAALAADVRWRTAAYSLGSWHVAAARSFWRAGNRLPHGSRGRSAAQAMALVLRAGPHLALPLIRRRALAIAARRRRAPFAAVLDAAGVGLRSLAVRYARGVPQPPAFRGFWHDEATHTTTGMIVGLDFVKNADGYWLIESNMDCGLGGRAALAPDDPFVRGLVELTAGQGYRRLMLVAGSTSIDANMARQFRERAAERNVGVEIFESAFEPRYGHRRTVEMPLAPPPGTLLVRNRPYGTGLDYVVHNKRASSRALRIYKRETGDTSFHLPATSADPEVTPADPSDPYPNLVFKYPEVDDGEGVVFLKVDSPAQARQAVAEAVDAFPDRGVLNRLYSRSKDGRGIWQSYVPTPWLADRRLFKVRAFVLLTPVGVHYFASHRTVCAKPLPMRLPHGLVADPEPYLVSFRPARGSTWRLTPPEEEPALKEAALGVARGLARALDYGFQSRPG